MNTKQVNILNMIKKHRDILSDCEYEKLHSQIENGDEEKALKFFQMKVKKHDR